MQPAVTSARAALARSSRRRLRGGPVRIIKCEHDVAHAAGVGRHVRVRAPGDLAARHIRARRAKREPHRDARPRTRRGIPPIARALVARDQITPAHDGAVLDAAGSLTIRDSAPEEPSHRAHRQTSCRLSRNGRTGVVISCLSYRAATGACSRCTMSAHTLRVQ